MTNNTKPRPAKKAMRSFYCEWIERLLTERGQMTRGQILAELRISEDTLATYLAYMRDELQKIRHSSEFLNGRAMWELGASTAPARKFERVEDLPEQRNTVQAEQIGMWRDSLVAALFGPARAAA